jgi:membrane protease YdiL (CAAX protease family)
MKDIFQRREFGILLVASVITSFMVLPYVFALTPEIAKLFTPVVMAAQIIQATIIFTIAIILGLALMKKVGFEAPLLSGTKPLSYLKSIWKISVGMGVLGGILIILFSLPFGELSVSFLQAEMRVATWRGIMASFYGGIAEEIVFRLFLMTLLVWVTTKFTKKVTPGGIWTAIIISSVLFGLGHLGITGGLAAITPLIIFRAILLNGVSVLFGWLYWKKGLEAAMIAHFTTDVVIHVLTPIVGRMILG